MPRPRLPFAPVVLAGLALAAAALAAPAATPRPDAGELVRAELDFARDCAALNVRDGFLKWLAPTAVGFQNGPVMVRKAYAARPVTAARLSWTPARAVLSASGDLGWTTGPYAWRSDSTANARQAYGEYVTLWRRQGDGSWRAVLDAGIDHESPGRIATDPALTTLPDPARALPSLQARRALWQADAAFARSVASAGAAAALAEVATDDVCVLREGSLPWIGRALAHDSLAARGGSPALVSTAQFVSGAGDLGYTYGSSAAGADTSWYVHAWQRAPDGRWRLALDLLVPHRR